MQTDTGTQSGLVRGFMEKLAGYSPEMQQLAIARAVRLHPEIAKEFQKAAVGGLSRAGTANMQSAATAQASPAVTAPTTTPALSQPAAAATPSLAAAGRGRNALPTAKPANTGTAAAIAAAGRGRNRPANPAAPQVPTPAGVTPASEENWFTRPFNAVREVMDGSTTDRLLGDKRQTFRQSRTMPGVYNMEDQWIQKSPNTKATGGLGAAIETAKGVGGMIPAIASDAIESVRTGKGQLNNTRMMSQNAMAGVNHLLDADIGYNVAPDLRSDLDNTTDYTEGTYIPVGPGQGRKFFGDRVNPVETHPNPDDRLTTGALNTMTADQRMKGMQGDTHGKSWLGRVGHNTLADTVDTTEMLLPIMAGGPLLNAAKGATGAAAAASTAPSLLGVGSAAGAPALYNAAANYYNEDKAPAGAFDGQPRTTGTVTAEPWKHEGLQQVSDAWNEQAVAAASPYNQPYASDAEAAALDVADAGVNNFVADADLAARGPQSVLAENPAEGQANAVTPDSNSVLAEPPPNLYDTDGRIAKRVAEDPETAQAQVTEVKNQVSTIADTTAAKQQLENVKQTGALTPDATADAVAKLEEQVGDPEAAKSMFEKMTTPEKFAVWGGLTIGALGLINAVAGNGGVGSWLATILGLGTAAYAGAGAGLLGEDAQNFTKDINKRVGTEIGDAQAGIRTVSDMGKPQSDGFGSKIMSVIGRMLTSDMVTPEGLQGTLRQIVSENPDMATKLDQLTGHGGLVNSVMSYAGELTGESDRLLKQYGITTPEQKNKLQQAWEGYRAANPRN